MQATLAIVESLRTGEPVALDINPLAASAQ
jgi:hypothetical protein